MLGKLQNERREWDEFVHVGVKNTIQKQKKEKKTKNVKRKMKNKKETKLPKSGILFLFYQAH